MKLTCCPNFLFILLFLANSITAVAQEHEEPVIQAILFYSPTCPHCHTVLTEILTPMAEQYADQLQILGVDTSQEAGQYLFEMAIMAFQVPKERWAVPMLIVGEVVMVGSMEIEQQFQDLIKDGLAAGGVGWPDIPNLTTIVPDLPPFVAVDRPPVAEEESVLAITPSRPAQTGEGTAESTNTEVAATVVAEPLAALTPEAAVADEEDPATLSVEAIELTQEAAEPLESPLDVAGFTLGWAVLISLLAGVAYGIRRAARAWPSWPVLQHSAAKGPARIALVLLLVFAGLIVSVYLSYVEVTQVEAACGPIGECNVVQSSGYAQIMGIPVALLGTLFYLAFGLLWLVRFAIEEWVPGLSVPSLLALSLLGTLFSIYLTFLELLVIHAICAWCLTSALVTVTLFLIVVQSVSDDRFAHAQVKTRK